MNLEGNPGSVSTGTLNERTLIKRFSTELDRLSQDADDQQLCKDAAEWLAAPKPDETDDLIDELTQALDAHAPPGCRFGPHEDDPADWGFWPI